MPRDIHTPPQVSFLILALKQINTPCVLLIWAVVACHPWVGCASIASCPHLTSTLPFSLFPCPGNSKKEGKEMSAPQVMVTIPLEEKITEMDATSRDTGIEDASSDQISSRGSSDNDLKKLACEEERPSAFTLTFAFWWSRCQGPLDICRRYFKWLLLILYNGYLILGVHRTWSKVSTCLSLPATATAIDDTCHSR